MNLMLRYPLRYLVIGILAGFAIVIGLLTYLTTRPVVIQRVEQEASDHLRDELNQLQGVLQLLLRAENLAGARSVVASLGSAPEHERALLTDAGGSIVASTRFADVGAAWTSLDLPLDTRLIEQVGASGGEVVRLEPDAQRLTGYVHICGTVGAETLRPRQCGFLYQQINFKEAKATAVAVLHRQAVGYGLGLAVVAGVLGCIFHHVVTRRVESLIAMVNRFTEGDTTARAGLQGQDELARVGHAFDTMAQTIASNQTQLQSMNTQLAQRLTEREQAEEALRQSEAQIRAILDTAVDGIISITEHGTILSFNPAAEHLFGYQAEEVQGQNINLLMPSPYGEEHDEYLAQYLSTGENKIIGIGREVVGQRKDCTTFPIDLSVGEAHVGNQRFFTGIVRDITRRKQAQEALRQAHDELEQRVRDRTAALELANEEVRRFAYIVSHDLRAPLINLKGFAGELRDLCELLNTVLPQLLPHLEKSQHTEVTRAITQDGPEALNFIETSVTRMDGLIRAVLDLSRAGQRELYIEPVDTEALAQHIAQTLTHQLTQSDAHITIEPLPTVNADHIAMEQILGNLLGNAVKYLKRGRPGEITVTSEQETEVTRFQVRDNGRGIAEGDLPRVFELFRRVGRQDTQGEGTGLSYVQALVRRHGGELTCQSTLGAGTTFSFTIANSLVLGGRIASL